MCPSYALQGQEGVARCQVPEQFRVFPVGSFKTLVHQVASAQKEKGWARDVPDKRTYGEHRHQFRTSFPTFSTASAARTPLGPSKWGTTDAAGLAGDSSVSLPPGRNRLGSLLLQICAHRQDNPGG